MLLIFLFLAFWVVLLHLHDCRVLPVFVKASAAPQEQLLSFPHWGIQKDPTALQPQPSGQPGPSAEPSKPKPSWLLLHHLARRRRVMLKKRQVRKCLFSPAHSLMQWVGRLCLSRTNGRVPLFLPSCPWFTSYFSVICHSQTV